MYIHIIKYIKLESTLTSISLRWRNGLLRKQGGTLIEVMKEI